MRDMENNKKFDFKKYYLALDDADKIKVRNKIVSECGFSISSFYYKLNHNNFKKLEVVQIGLIIEELNAQGEVNYSKNLF